MTGFRRAAAATLAALLLTIAACSALPGGGGGSDEPAGVVNAAIAAAESGGFSKLADYSCAANKGDIANAFGAGGNIGQLQSAGIDVNEVFDAMKIDFQDATATESSKTDSAATVHLKGKLAVTFDETKMKAILKKFLEAQQLPATDQMVDAAMSSMASALTQTQDLDSDLQLVKENGKWVICG